MSDFEDIDIPDADLLTEDELRIKADTIFIEAGKDIKLRSKALDEICKLLLLLNDDFAALDFIKQFAKAHIINLSQLKAKYTLIKKETEGNTEDKQFVIKLPKDLSEDEEVVKSRGFFAHRNSYKFITKDGIFKASNYVIKPLYHIDSKIDNKRLVEITNEFNHKQIVDIPSKYFISVDLFGQRVFDVGNYIFYGTKSHFLKILGTIANDFPLCEELRTLGWQREGFFAFSNGIFNESYFAVDKFGMVTHKEKMYFLPAFSCVYANVREDDDEYENDRFFIFQQSKVQLKEWCNLMLKVYGDNGKIAISFAIASLFRDIIYEKYKIFPHLFLFGEKQSGKSQLGWSLSNLFFNSLPPFNLNSGTQVGFFRRLARIKNGLAWFDEYTNDIDEKRFQSLKSAYDGVGHEKGEATKDNRTKITKVNSACIISGQYLPTRDDNALLTRSITLNFEKKKYTNEEIQNYNDLKQVEETGLSSILTEILKYRHLIDEKFAICFYEVFENIKTILLNNKQNFEERLLRNYSCILTSVKILLENVTDFDLGFSYDEIEKLSLKNIHDLSNQISSSEALATFFNLLEFMLDKGEIFSGIDFEIKPVYHFKARDKSGIEKTIAFLDDKNEEIPQKCIFIRLNKIHPLYLESHRKQYGVNGIDLVSLTHYIKNNKAYLGYIDTWRFENSRSSCFAFNYELLGCNLERFSKENLNEDTNTNKGDLPF